MILSEQRKLANRIARDLFTFGTGERADRLVLLIERPLCRDLGGWSESALAERVYQHLSGVIVEGRASPEATQTKP